MICMVFCRFTGISLDFHQCHTLASMLQFKKSPLRVLELSDCLYGYPQDYSSYFSKEEETGETVEDFNIELSLLTVIPTALISPVSTLKGFR